MARFEFAAYDSVAGGVAVNPKLTDMYDVDCRMSIDLSKVDKSDVTRMLTFIKDGFATSKDSVPYVLLKTIRRCVGAPSCPEIGYLGKQDMHILVLGDRVKDYNRELVAAAHMFDIDLRNGASYRSYEGARDLSWLTVNGESNRSKNAGRAERLTAKTSKLAELLRTWTAEWADRRQALYEYVAQRPRLEIHIQKQAKFD